jgi:hypothetical protein
MGTENEKRRSIGRARRSSSRPRPRGLRDRMRRTVDRTRDSSVRDRPSTRPAGVGTRLTGLGRMWAKGGVSGSVARAAGGVPKPEALAEAVNQRAASTLVEAGSDGSRCGDRLPDPIPRRPVSGASPRWPYASTPSPGPVATLPGKLARRRRGHVRGMPESRNTVKGAGVEPGGDRAGNGLPAPGPHVRGIRASKT